MTAFMAAWSASASGRAKPRKTIAPGLRVTRLGRVSGKSRDIWVAVLAGSVTVLPLSRGACNRPDGRLVDAEDNAMKQFTL